MRKTKATQGRGGWEGVQGSRNTVSRREAFLFRLCSGTPRGSTRPGPSHHPLQLHGGILWGRGGVGSGGRGDMEKTPKPRSLSLAGHPACLGLGLGKAGRSQREPLTQENPFTFPKAAVPSRRRQRPYAPAHPSHSASSVKERVSPKQKPLWLALGSSPAGSPSHLSRPLQSGSSPEWQHGPSPSC